MVVTGGAGVLGQAVAGMAKANGAEVVLLDVVPEFESPLGRVYCIDLTDEQAVAACFQEIGAVHAVANIAGGFDMGPSVDTTSDALWDELFQINVQPFVSRFQSIAAAAELICSIMVCSASFPFPCKMAPKISLC